MNQNNLTFSLLICVVCLWLGCGPAKMDEAAVQQHATQIETMQSANREQLKHNAVSEATLTQEIGKQYDSGFREFAWINGVVQTVSKDRHYLLATIKECRAELEKIAGKDVQLGTYSTPNESSTTYKLMMGDAKTNGGRGSGYAIKVRDAARSLYDGLLLSAKNAERNLEIPALAEDSTGGVWEVQHFGNASALMALEELEALTKEALACEALLIDDLVAELKLAEKVEENKALKTKGKMALRSTNYADTVAAGMKMEALLTVDNLPFGASVDFRGSGVVNNMIGKDHAPGILKRLIDYVFSNEDEWRDFPSGDLSATAPGGFAKGQDTKPQRFKVFATVTLAEGDQEELSATANFVVRKPRAVITPGPETPLRKGQPNKLKIDVPDFGEFYGPHIEATEATVQQNGMDKRLYTITPTGNTTTISISSNTNGQRIMVDRVTFQVK